MKSWRSTVHNMNSRASDIPELRRKQADNSLHHSKETEVPPLDKARFLSTMECLVADLESSRRVMSDGGRDEETASVIKENL